MTELYGGIDGGQSSTDAAVCDRSGKVLGRGAGPPADLVGEAPDSPRQRLALEAALAAALRAAGLAEQTRLAALVIGLTGHDSGAPVPWLAATHAATYFVHDTEIAHAGALGGATGIVVLAGTGSVALGNAPGGDLVRAGGWGYFFGDEGGALWIARRALATAMVSADRGRSSPLAAAALAFFNVRDLRAVQHAFARGSLTRPELAAFAPEALAQQTQDARELCAAAAAALVELVATLDERLPRVEGRRVSHAGGVFCSDALRAAFARHLVLRLPHTELVEPQAGPLEGALLLARKFAREREPGRGRVAAR